MTDVGRNLRLDFAALPTTASSVRTFIVVLLWCLALPFVAVAVVLIVLAVIIEK